MKKITFGEGVVDKEKDKASTKPSALETVLTSKLNQRFQNQRQQYESSPVRPTHSGGTMGTGTLSATNRLQFGDLNASLPMSPLGSPGRLFSTLGSTAGGLHPLSMSLPPNVQQLLASPTRFNDEVRRRALDHIQGVEDEFKDKAQAEFGTRVEIEKAELLRRLWPSELDISKSKAGKIIEKKVEVLAKQHVRRRMQLETEFLKLTQLGLRQVIEEEAAQLRREILQMHNDAVAAQEEAERQAQLEEQQTANTALLRRSVIGSRLSFKGGDQKELKASTVGPEPAKDDGPEYVLEKVDWLEARAGQELEWLDHTGASMISEDVKKLDERFMDVLLRSGAVLNEEKPEPEDDDLFYHGKNRIKKRPAAQSSRSQGLASRELVNVMLAAVKQAVEDEADEEAGRKSDLDRKAREIAEAGGEERGGGASWMRRGVKTREDVAEDLQRERALLEAENHDDGSYDVLGMKRKPKNLAEKFGNLLGKAEGMKDRHLDIAGRLSRWTADAVNRVSARGSSLSHQAKNNPKPKLASMRTASEVFMMACKERKAVPSAKLAVQLDNHVVDMTSTLIDLRNALSFSDVLSKGLCLNLRSLRLSNASLTDEAAAAIIRASKILPIKELVLRGNKIGMETAAELALALNPSSREIRRIVLLMRTPAVELVPTSAFQPGERSANPGTSLRPSTSAGRPMTADPNVRTRVMSAQTYRPISREMERFSTVLVGNSDVAAHRNAWTRRNPHEIRAPAFGAPPPKDTAVNQKTHAARSPANLHQQQQGMAPTILYTAQQTQEVPKTDEEELDVSTRWHKTLRDLDISSNAGLGDKGAALLLRALGRALDNTTTTKQPGRLITGSTMDHSMLAAPAIGEEETIPRLEVLLMEGCGLTDALHVELENVLTTNTSLITINLAWNKLRSGSASAIARAVLAGSRLQDLDVGNNGLGDAGVAEILWALHQSMEPDTDIINHRGHLYLSRLGVRCTKMGPKSTLALAALMPQIAKWGRLNEIKFAPEQYKLSIDMTDTFVGGVAGQCLLRALGKYDADFRVGTEQYERLANVPGVVPSTELSLALLARDQYRRREQYAKGRGDEATLPGTSVSLSLRAESFSSAHLEAQREAPAIPGADTKKKGKKKTGGKKAKQKEGGDKKAAAKSKAPPPLEPPKPSFGKVGIFMTLNLAQYRDRQLVAPLLEHDQESSGTSFYNVCWNNKVFREKGVDVTQGKAKCFRDFYTSQGWLDPEKGLPAKGILELDVLLVPYSSASWKERDQEVLALLEKEQNE